MSDADKKQRRSQKTLWITIVAIILILLLLWWMFVAITSGDTDINATPIENVQAIAPMLGLGF